MRGLVEAHKWSELIQQFKDEDIAVWPDDVAAEGFEQRGKAYSYLKEGGYGAAVGSYNVLDVGAGGKMMHAAVASIKELMRRDGDTTGSLK